MNLKKLLLWSCTEIDWVREYRITLILMCLVPGEREALRGFVWESIFPSQSPNITHVTVKPATKHWSLPTCYRPTKRRIGELKEGSFFLYQKSSIIASFPAIKRVTKYSITSGEIMILMPVESNCKVCIPPNLSLGMTMTNIYQWKNYFLSVTNDNPRIQYVNEPSFTHAYLLNLTANQALNQGSTHA